MQEFKGVDVKVGLIGCGRWGQNHARTLAGLGALDAVADGIVERRDSVAAEHGVRSMTAEAIFADPAIGAVVLTLPPSEQAAMALRALAAGKHLMVEKPMALDVAMAERIVTTAEAMGVVAMTGHLLLFHPAYRALAEVVASGRLGSLRHIRSVRAGQGAFFPGTDVAWDLLPHDLSLLLDLNDGLPAQGRLEGVSTVSDRNDIATLRMRYPDGPLVECFASRVAPERERKLIVQGSRASVVWDDMKDWPEKLRVIDNPGPGIAQGEAEIIPVEPAQSLEAMLRHFLDCITTGATPRCSVADGYETLRLLAVSAAPATPATRPAISALGRRKIASGIA